MPVVIKNSSYRNLAYFHQRALLQPAAKLVGRGYYFLYDLVNALYSKYFKEFNYPYRTLDVFECEFILMEAMVVFFT